MPAASVWRPSAVGRPSTRAAGGCRSRRNWTVSDVVLTVPPSLRTEILDPWICGERFAHQFCVPRHTKIVDQLLEKNGAQAPAFQVRAHDDRKFSADRCRAATARATPSVSDTPGAVSRVGDESHLRRS